MKELKSKTIKAVAARARRRWKAVLKSELPSDGTLLPVLTHTAKNGWYYQADIVHDSRICGQPLLMTVFAFAPGHRYGEWATHYYQINLKKGK